MNTTYMKKVARDFGPFVIYAILLGFALASACYEHYVEAIITTAVAQGILVISERKFILEMFGFR